MRVRLAIMALALALLGCEGESERSRVVPASETPRPRGEASHKLAPGEIRKIEMH
jgi:hypothetical protein